jgi:hypothetical protein
VPGYRVADPQRIGDLHGAIAGVDHSGLIGATYRLFPFPSDPAGFKQRPDAEHVRSQMEVLAAEHGVATEIALSWDPTARVVSIGEFRFGPEVFDRLIAYVDRGGYPRWRDEIRPAYVSAMMRRLSDPRSPVPWRRREPAH